ncbi:MAG: guanylate kinase [Lachnospiraceae bacterium]|nr:guanylate kinase [Lachnospiraceae bacterium]
MGKLFIVMGKSASGKDAVYRNLLQDKSLDLKKIVLYTTRPMRQKEEDGKQYFFVDEDFYQEKERAGKVIEKRDYHTQLGLWRYFTADDGQIDLAAGNYLMIGTVDAYVSMKEYFGAENVVPLLIDTDDGIRLGRALKRELRQEVPRYDEMCRRYLADTADYSPERLAAAGIETLFDNNDTIESCIKEVTACIHFSIRTG